MSVLVFRFTAFHARARSATGSAPIRSPSDDVSISTDMNGDEENWPWPDADTDAVPVK